MLRPRVALLLFERLLVDTDGRDDWLLTVAPLFLTGVARCVRAGVLWLWFTAGLELRWTLCAGRLWCVGAVARVALPRAAGAVRCVRVAAGLAVVDRVAGAVRVAGVVLPRLAAGRAVVERVAGVALPLVAVLRVAGVAFRLVAVRVAVAARPLPFRLLAVRAVAASVTREGRAEARLLRSTSGR